MGWQSLDSLLWVLMTSRRSTPFTGIYKWRTKWTAPILVLLLLHFIFEPVDKLFGVF
jgi:hypothetical protein